MGKSNCRLTRQAESQAESAKAQQQMHKEQKEMNLTNIEICLFNGASADIDRNLKMAQNLNEESNRASSQGNNGLGKSNEKSALFSLGIANKMEEKKGAIEQILVAKLNGKTTA